MDLATPIAFASALVSPQPLGERPWRSSKKDFASGGTSSADRHPTTDGSSYWRSRAGFALCFSVAAKAIGTGSQDVRHRRMKSTGLRLTKAQLGRDGRCRPLHAVSEEPETEEGGTEKVGFLKAFWKFLRPHTIRGTILGSSAMVVRVLLERGMLPDWSLVPRALCGVVALLCGNGYIVGINQIYDVDIDVINKPFLPVAAKEISPGLAWILILAMASCGAALAWRLFGPLIGGLYFVGLFLGTIYSVPPLRLKQFAVPAALIIAIVRGFLLNFGVYYATRAALGISFSWSAPAVFITCFMSVFATVIAVTKDLPDVQGDKENQIETFSTRFGVGKVSLAATLVLIANYASTYIWAFASRTGGSFNAPVFLGTHTIFALALARGFLRLKAANFTEDALKAYYRLIWLLLYSEYLFFPLI
mmetsp:Transcript_8600/g.15426  ORF Transcript_8600/g.15426 Transcript_8600/m.15426 type:complete len:419 (+) Transcript_8600:80-1336(+)